MLRGLRISQWGWGRQAQYCAVSVGTSCRRLASSAGFSGPGRGRRKALWSSETVVSIVEPRYNAAICGDISSVVLANCWSQTYMGAISRVWLYIPADRERRCRTATLHRSTPLQIPMDAVKILLRKYRALKFFKYWEREKRITLQ